MVAPDSEPKFDISKQLKFRQELNKEEVKWRQFWSQLSEDSKFDLISMKNKYQRGNFELILR